MAIESAFAVSTTSTGAASQMKTQAVKRVGLAWVARADHPVGGVDEPQRGSRGRAIAVIERRQASGAGWTALRRAACAG